MKRMSFAVGLAAVAASTTLPAATVSVSGFKGPRGPDILGILCRSATLREKTSPPAVVSRLIRLTYDSDDCDRVEHCIKPPRRICPRGGAIWYNLGK